MVSYAAGSFSLPAGQLAAVPEEDGAGGLARECFLDVHHMLVNEKKLGAVLQNSELPGCYFDPILANSPSKHADVLVEMSSAGIIRFDVVPLL